MRYELFINIVPNEHYIKVTGKINNIEISSNAVNVFYLNDKFNINKLTSNSKEIGFIRDNTTLNNPFHIVSKAVFLKEPVKSIEFQYDGYVTEVLCNVNQISEHIVELASYSGWYPYGLLYTDNIENFNPDIYIENEFEFEITVELPAEYVFAADAEIKRIDTSHKDKNIYYLSSFDVDGDIAIFASNKVVRIDNDVDGYSISSICPPAMERKNTLKLDILIEAQKRMTDLFGEPRIKQSTCYINRPYGGWGYARTGYIIMPGITDENDDMLKDLSRKSLIYFSGLDFHELAHYWWGIAPSEDSNDWINEGGAEFTMLTLQKDMLNHENHNNINEKIKLIQKCPTDEAIIETPNYGEIREINFYHKTTIMLIGAEIRFGRNNLIKFLKEFYNQYKIECDADTEKFLNVCDKVLGNEAREYFHWLLYSKGWKNIDIKKDILMLQT